MDKEIEAYKIEFAGIEILGKALAEPNILEEKKEITFGYSFICELKVNPKMKSVFAITQVKIISKENIEFATLKTMCVFILSDFDDVMPLRDGIYDVPVNLEITLKSVAVSTTRGVLFSELRGTYLGSAILPLFDVASIVLEQRNKPTETKSTS